MGYNGMLKFYEPYGIRIHTRCFLWALFMVVLGAYAYGGEDASAKTSKSFEASKIKAGLSKIGVGESYEIVIADECDMVENTAAEMMQRFLAKASLPARIVKESQATGDKRILLGRESNLKAIRALGDSGELSIRDVSAEDDGFHLKQIGKSIVIAGANPRGVLYGVYAFEDFIRAGEKGKLDIKKVPYYRKRGSGLYYTYGIFNTQLASFPEENAACLSRLGINQMTDQGIGGHLSKFVKSDVFPFQTPPDPEYQRRLKEMAATCKKYGIDVYLFLLEPALEPVNGSFEQYPEEALGTVRPPWGGDDKGMARTLCVSSPLTQKYLKNMMRKLVREYPDVKGVQLYNLDAGSWFCTPELCERCKRACTDSPPDAFNPWETQTELVGLLAGAAHEENPGFDFRFWSTVHYHGEIFDKLIHAMRGYDGLICSWTGSDRSIMVPDAAERTATCVLSQEACKQRDVPFYMIGEFNNLEMIPKSLPFPFHVCDALQKFKKWDVKNLTEIFGLAPEHNSINALVTKEFEWNPDQDTKAFLTGLAHRQFGTAAGDHMYRAWEEMRKAFDVWNDVKSPPFPMNGSQNHVKMGLAIGDLPPAITPNIVEYYDSMLDTLTRVEPWLAAGYEQQRTEAFLDKMLLMNKHFARAAELAKKAADAASSEAFIGLCYYETPNGAPTQKQYAELNYAPIAMADILCAQRCDILRAYLALKALETARAAGDQEETHKKEQQYQALLRDDIALQERFCDLLTRFSKMPPCYTRTILTEEEIANHLAFTRAKIEELKAHLVKASTAS